ncbi:hypothetical protein [Notoacmeibacter sp. MSK16QG-6]|uniref:DUF7282 domain-containing protein n=1 Tax=Notoacmeibacter sp. MSK16QG-6 TaxID=2957982 RepID=UPI0020A0CB88|nr:hypothetical protein [Notoacmeibacter sp. MSK16QG-6]MCP1199870.1 hypothetical protein [Notoacmeibacter sp. MSK16QG-6]
MNKFILSTAAVMALGISGAYAQEASDQPADMATMIGVDNAKVEDGKITGISVDVNKAGYLVVHDDAAGAPPASLGHIAVQPGSTENVSIDLTGEPGSGLSLMLHEETNGNTTYDFGPGSTDVDTPMTVNGEPVVKAVGGM